MSSHPFEAENTHYFKQGQNIQATALHTSGLSTLGTKGHLLQPCKSLFSSKTIGRNLRVFPPKGVQSHVLACILDQSIKESATLYYVPSGRAIS